MKIKEIHVENYRSLRNITFRPGDLTVVIGANGSGKSNLASAFEFLSDVYDNGLEYAVLKKGGFENIAYRGKRRTKSAIQFSVDYVLENKDRFPIFFHGPERAKLLRVKHSFAFKASVQTIRADYHVIEESLEFYKDAENDNLENCDTWPLYFKMTKRGEDLEVEKGQEQNNEEIDQYVDYLKITQKFNKSGPNIGALDLIGLGRGTPSGMSVHQFSPQIARAPGAPTPSPKLTSYGENLAALVDWLQRNHPKGWRQVESSMQEIVPGLEEIGVEFSSNKLLTLFFKEERTSRPWSSVEVSDGTIQTLAILCCLADPRVSLLFLEEPENSVHPWIVRQLAEQFKKYSKKSQAILTTHSPIILNVVSPYDVWICHKIGGETLVSHLPEVNPEVVEDWERGGGRLYDLLDLGLIHEAVPKGQLS